MSTKSALIIKFVQSSLKSLLVVLGGFLLAPTHILMTFYQEHESVRVLAVFVSALIVIFALFNMISISLKTISVSTASIHVNAPES